MDSPQNPAVASLGLEDLRDLYFYLGQIAAVATERRKALQPVILALMGDKTEMVTPDGWIFKREERITREYPISALRLVFDASQVDEVIKPDGKAVKYLAKKLLTKEQQIQLEKSLVETGKTEALKILPPTKETMEQLRS